MNANCVICSDVFDETNPIVAIPCGHIYHGNCISVWVAQSKSCPQCRSRTLLKSIQKLYFNFIPKSSANSSDLENEVASLNSQLSTKEAELVACKTELRDVYTFVSNTEERERVLLQANSSLHHEISEKMELVSKLRTGVSELEQMNKSLTADLKHYRNVHSMIKGSKREAESILRKYDGRSPTAEQLATYCSCLKLELLDAVQDKEGLEEVISKLESKNSAYAKEIKFYEDALNVPKSERNTATSDSPVIAGEYFFPADAPSTSTEGPISERLGMSPLSPLSIALNRNKFNMMCIHLK